MDEEPTISGPILLGLAARSRRGWILDLAEARTCSPLSLSPAWNKSAVGANYFAFGVSKHKRAVSAGRKGGNGI